jgi:phosphoheptose isomerase
MNQHESIEYRHPAALDVLDNLVDRYPALEDQREKIRQVADRLTDAFSSGHILLLCGNGGERGGL